MVSKITGGETELLFKAQILNKYEICYFRCKDTGFIQTEDPYWLDESYSSVITKLDLGLVHRNQILSKSVGKLIVKHFRADDRFLDYAGGYGLFTRIMRDKGLNFYHTDKYCHNVFAENFDLKNVPEPKTFEAVTAFEVFEHLKDPINEIKEIWKFSDNLFFSTELQPKKPIEKLNDWWYFAPETGQHISFYNEEALKVVADTLGCNYYTDGSFLHLFTKTEFKSNPFKEKKEPFLIRKIRKYLQAYDRKRFPFPNSLLQKDWEDVKNSLSSKGYF